ncbi:MAG: YfhO family protein [Lachnospiraceae bacterium]|nr:YfhO family protein [Lachnospiraceae bacterium]
MSLFHKASGQPSYKKTLLFYSILCITFALLIWYFYMQADRTVIWIYDGVYQHYAAFDYLCEAIKDLFHGNFAFFDYTIGQGADIYTTLNSYNLTDPVSALCACLVFLSRTTRYTLMLFIKLYLGGAAVIFYGYCIKSKNGFVVMCAALTYAFSGHMIYVLPRHPNFSCWYYCLPLILAGVELYRRQKKSLPLILFVFLAVVSNYYAAVIVLMLAAVYVVLLFIEDWLIMKEGLGTAFLKGLKIAGLMILGCLLAAVILIPTGILYLNNARVLEKSGYQGSNLHYTLKYYLRFYKESFLPNGYVGHHTVLGYNIVLFFPFVWALFSRKREYLIWKIMILVMTGFAFVPFFGKVLNGGGYVYNRWVFCLPLFFSILMIRVMPEFYAERSESSDQPNTHQKTQTLPVTLSIILYAATCWSLAAQDGVRAIAVIICLAVSSLLLLSCRKKKNVLTALTFVTTLIGIFILVFGRYSPSIGNYTGEFLETAAAEDFYAGHSSLAAVERKDGFYRVDKFETIPINTDKMNHVYGTSLWWSLLPSNVYEYYRGLGLYTVYQNCHFRGLDARSGLLQIADASYYTAPLGDVNVFTVPVGYEAVETENSPYVVYENDAVSYPAYVYSGYMTRDTYDALSGIDKEQALLQSCVIENESVDQVSGRLSEVTPICAGESLPYQIETKGISLDGATAIVEENGAMMTLTTEMPGNCAIYLSFGKTRVAPPRAFTEAIVTRRGADSAAQKTIKFENETYNWPSNLDETIIYLGCPKAGTNYIDIQFGLSGEYTLPDMQIIAVPVESYTAKEEALSFKSVKAMDIGHDRISVNVDMETNGILQLAVPYSTGWTAVVDGEKVDVLPTDVMYMGLPLEKGEHQIFLRYRTPGLLAGVLVSLLTLIGMIVSFGVRRRRRVKRTPHNTRRA